LRAHCEALSRGDVATVRAGLGPEATELAGLLAALPGPFERCEVVGCARIGRQRVVKLHLTGRRGRVVLQERWVPEAGGWRLAAAEVLGAESGA
jgi:hypothetical protein